MVRKVLQLSQLAQLAAAVSSPPPPPPPTLHGPLHVSNYQLPASSRLPKFMIAAVAGFILFTTAAYYFFKWFCFRKCCVNLNNVADTVSTESNNNSIEAPPDEIRDRAAKALAQRLGSKIAMSIPTMTYAQLVNLRADAKKSEEDVESEACAVCLSEFSKQQVGSVIKVLPTCCHAFHSSCIDLWLLTQASCPVCRASLFMLFSGSSMTSCLSPDSRPQGGGGGDNNV